MTKKVSEILKNVLRKIEPSKEEIKKINISLKEFTENLENEIKKLGIDAEIFIGGSFAKGTLIKKDKYDIDIYIRFDKKYKDEEISNLTKDIIKNFENVSIIHGSRDYFRISRDKDFFFELIPVCKINNPEDSKNITDLSYMHVKYIKKKAKIKKILDEIRLAKAFCYATNTYGAESYIKGFSGYAVELLICHYKTFLNLAKEISKIKKEQEVIDIEKAYKRKQNVFFDINSSKLKSPIILIDPVYKQRNALAALSKETFEKFQEECKKFVKNPSEKSFEIKKLNFEKAEEYAKKRDNEFIILEAKTNKQVGDIAGSKLIKFYNHLSAEIEKYFEIKQKGFEYDNNQSAKYFFTAKIKKEIIREGPNIKDKKNVASFKKEHKKTFEKKGRIYAKDEIKFNIKEFIERWKEKNYNKINEMSIIGLEIL